MVVARQWHTCHTGDEAQQQLLLADGRGDALLDGAGEEHDEEDSPRMRGTVLVEADVKCETPSWYGG